ncbi:HPr kinase/phosphorylase [Roseomonas sp. CECT 9278]|uniref:HPr kinase/phosphorylase n=1 Tax=Roseomonas sp. CECT 9278 TaxID=2845823 RepID=UPI001E54B568|nr:HPr kinase/phosphatase C-terminal domain-containing protein [Roseomonas sp. CECT 9278]CAH0192249.1 HPr kinase/phosphorylase [Roseomonas sp. CECT 9278]
MRVHGSCVARDGAAVLVLGPPGSGKSDLALRLIGRGFRLVADDQVLVEGRAVSPPPALRGLLEVRGLGIFEALPVAEGARLALAVDLVAPEGVTRLPRPACWGDDAVPRIALHGFEASACDKLAWALDAAIGLRAQRAGAFAA